jgi:hypothetical protein
MEPTRNEPVILVPNPLVAERIQESLPETLLLGWRF